MDDRNQNNINNFVNNIRRSSLNPSMERLQFKNEILSDVKRTQKLGEDKLEKLMEIIETKFSEYDKEIIKLNGNVQDIKNIKPEGNILNEHVKDLLSFQSEAKDDLITIKIKIENLDKDISNNVYRIDKILSESIIYPGTIGNASRFKTFHDFIDYILTQASKNITFREKSEMDLKTYKNKMDKYLKNFSSQLDNLLKEANIFTKKSIEEVEAKMKILLDEVNGKIQSIRFDKTNIIKEFEKNSEILKKEIVKINEMKDEINKILEEKILIIQEENSRIMGNYAENKNDINLINDRLNQLSDYIKEIRLKTGKKSKKEEFKIKENKNELNKSQENKEDIKPLNNKIKQESKIKKYIYGEINAKDLEMNKDSNINNNRMSNKYINIQNNISEEKKISLNNYSSTDNNNKNKFKNNSSENINEFSSKSTNNYHLDDNKNDSVYENKNNKIEDKYKSGDINSNNKYNQNNNKNKNLKINETKLSLNKKDISIKNGAYNGVKTIIPKTSKIIKNARKDINLRNIKNKQITYSNKPKNRNPKEIKKQIKNNNVKFYKKHKKNKKEKINKEEFESEENEEEDEEEDEESSENVGENLSCDDINESSESEYSNDNYEREISNKNFKYKKKIIRKYSKISLPKIRELKRSSSSKNTKIKTVPNNYNKIKEKKIKYLNNKSRNNNIKNFENKNDDNNKEIFSKKSDINKKREATNEHNNKFKNNEKYVEKQSKSSQTNMENKNYYDKEIIEEEDDDINNNEYLNKENIYSFSKYSLTNNINDKFINIKNDNSLSLTQNIEKSSNYKKINSQLKEDINIKNNNLENSTNNINSEIDIKQIDIKNLEIKNLNRNIKNYIKYGFKLKDKYDPSLNNNNSTSRYLSLGKCPKNNTNKEYNNNEKYNISDLKQKKNYNEYSNIKSRNKIINKNNNDLVNNINNNIINNLKNNTYQNLPRMFNDSDI